MSRHGECRAEKPQTETIGDAPGGRVGATGAVEERLLTEIRMCSPPSRCRRRQLATTEADRSVHSDLGPTGPGSDSFRDGDHFAVDDGNAPRRPEIGDFTEPDLDE